jgi:tripartite-type tricarboxylate transporter receptor subunit TctC
MMKQFKTISFLFAIFFFGFLASIHAQDVYPSRPVKIIAPQATGGGVDIVGRYMADQLNKELKQTFIIDNQAGAGGAIAGKMTIIAPPDGYTLMIGYVATHATTPAVKKNIYDPIKDFTPIAMFGGTPNILVIAKDVPANNLKDFIAYAIANPNKVNYGTSGIGTLNHLLMEQFKYDSGVKSMMVPYRSIGQAFTDSMSGQIQVIFPGLSAALPHIRSGGFKPLAVTGEQRSPLLPDVPTFKELGFGGFDGLTWYGLVGPPKLSDAIVQKINKAVNKSLEKPEVKRFFLDQALKPMPMTPNQFEKYISQEVIHWTKIAKASNITAE